MSGKYEVNIEIKKTHVAFLAIIMFITIGTATVNVRDNLNVFQELNMNNNPITGLQDPSNAQDAATKNYVDNNAGSEGVTDGSNLNWYKCSDSGDSASCSVSCPSDQSLIAEAYKSGYKEDDPFGWYDTWLNIDSEFYDDGSFGAPEYGSGRVLSRDGTKGEGVSVSRGSSSFSTAYVTAVVACK